MNDRVTKRQPGETVQPDKTWMGDVRVILFDWGGTLCRTTRQEDTRPASAKAAMDYCAAGGLKLPPVAQRDLLRRFSEALDRANADPQHREIDTPAMLTEWLQAFDRALPDERLAELTERVWQPWIGCLDVIDGVPEALQALRARGYVLGLVSNVAAEPRSCRAELQRLGLADLLSFTTFSSGVGFRKPDHRIYHAALAAAGDQVEDLQARLVLFVGDTPLADITGPSALGMRTAWVVPDGADLDEAAPADLRISTVAELPDVLAALLEK